MFKFLRKYNTIILAIGGSLLLIVFLIPQAIQSLSRSAGAASATVATYGADGQYDLKRPELDQARAELEVLQTLGGVGTIDVTTPEHWFLLTLEAQAAGLIGSGSPIQVELLNALAANTGKSPALVATVYNKLIGVSDLLGLYQGGTEFSQPRLTAEGDNLFHTVVCTSVVLQGQDKDNAATPSDAEIEAQFQKYAAILAGEGEDVFGYRLPDRVQLEWITVDAAGVREQIAATDGKDVIELHKHWKKIQGTSGIPLISDLPDGASVPDEVVQALIDQRLEQKMRDIRRFGQEQIRRPQRELDGDEEGFLVLPADWADKRAPLDTLADNLRERFGIARPARQAIGEWIEPEELRPIEGLGLSFSDDYGQRMNVTRLMTMLKEFGGDGTIPMQEHTAMPVLADGQGNLYFARVVAADPSHPPASVDEVRDQVVADLHRQADFEAMAADLNGIRNSAAAGGLVSLAMAYDTVVHRPHHVSLIDSLTRVYITQGDTTRKLAPSPLPVIGGREDIVKQIVDYGRTLDITKSVTELEMLDRIVVVPVPDQLAIVVGRIDSQIPFSQEDYDLMTEQFRLQTVLLRRELDDGESIDRAFGQDAMYERHNFVFNRSDNDEEDEEATEEEVAAAE